MREKITILGYHDIRGGRETEKEMATFFSDADSRDTKSQIHLRDTKKTARKQNKRKKEKKKIRPEPQTGIEPHAYFSHAFTHP